MVGVHKGRPGLGLGCAGYIGYMSSRMSNVKWCGGRVE